MYLVAGGYFYQDNANVVFLDSTEIMVKEKIGWEVLQKHPLPHPMKDLRGISLRNKIFMIGTNLLSRGSNSLATTVATANMYENIRIMNISQYTFDKNLSFLL